MTQLDIRLLQILKLSGVAITAQVEPDGKLLPVVGGFEKLLAAAREKSFPRIHTVIVAKGQSLADFNLVKDPYNPNLFKDPHADFHILCAGTLAEVATLLSVDTQTRWGGIDCSLPPRNPHFVGREQLFTAVQDFIATHDAGYLVIIGGMGKGKSTFMAELIHSAQRRGDEPIYHIIDYHPSASGEPHQIAACLYDRLRRKYVFLEPQEWNHLSIEDKLERLLNHLSQTTFQERQAPEVLYIDAADQAEATAKAPLLPGTLRHLPPGIICIITSRSHLAWLRTWQAVTMWEMDDYIDDRSEVRAYLQQSVSHLSLPLPNALIEQIVTQPDPPVFFTIATRLRQLKASTQVVSLRQQLLTDASLWVAPPEELVHTEALRVVAEAEAIGIPELKVWQTLGLLAVARADLSEEQMDHLGLWEEGTTSRILKLATNFFSPRPQLRAPGVPYRFDHPGYHREILSHLKQRSVVECHHLLAQGCVHWRNLDGFTRLYALRYLPTHLREAKMWDELCDVLTDFDYLQIRISSETFTLLATDLSSTTLRNLSPLHEQPEILTRYECAIHTTRQLDLSKLYIYGNDIDLIVNNQKGAEGIFNLLRDFHDVLEAMPLSHPQREQVAMLHRLMDKNSFILKDAPSLLIQQVYNVLVWDWDEETVLGRRIRETANICSRTWLKQLNRPRITTHSVLLRTLTGHIGAVYSVAFSPDGKTIASGGGYYNRDPHRFFDKTVKLWDIETGMLQLTLAGHSDSVLSVAFAPDGQTIASGSWDKTVRLWDVETGTMKLILTGHSVAVSFVAFSPDGQSVVSGSNDSTIKVWDLQSGMLKRTLNGHGGHIAFAPDGKLVVGGAGDGSVLLWDLQTGQLECLLTGTVDAVYRALLSPDGKTVATISSDRAIKLWNADTGTLRCRMTGHSDLVWSISFSPDGKYIASGSWDRTVKLWDTHTGDLIGTLIGHGDRVEAVTFSPDGSLVASGSFDRTVKLWNVQGGTLVRTPMQHEAEVWSVAFSLDGKIAVSGSQDATMKLWNTESGALIGVLRGHSEGIYSVNFSPNGKTVVSASGDNTLKLWDVQVVKLQHTLIGHSGKVYSVTFSPDGRTVVSGSEDKTLKFWNPWTGGLERTLTGHTTGVYSVLFSPDGELLASGSAGSAILGQRSGEVNLWNARTGVLKQRLEGYTGAVISLAFSPDGKILASGGLGGSVAFWDTKTGKLKLTLKGHIETVYTLAFSPDGNTMASGSSDNLLKVWDAKTGALLAWLPCMATVRSLWVDPALPQLRIADAGDVAFIPNIYIFELVKGKV